MLQPIERWQKWRGRVRAEEQRQLGQRETGKKDLETCLTGFALLMSYLDLPELLLYSRKRSEGFPFIVWGSGGWTRVRFVCCVASFRRASRRGASLSPCHADLRFGRVARVACVALCHGDCCSACRVGGAVPWGSASRTRRVCGVCGAVPWGLLLGGSRGCRCAMRIAGGRVAWVALCHADCWWACRVGGAVPWGLLLGVSRGWRRAMGTAGRVAWGRGRVAWVALCHGDCCWAGRVGPSWGLLTRRPLGGAVSWGLLVGEVRSCDVLSRHVTSCRVTSCHTMPCHVTSCDVLS